MWAVAGTSLVIAADEDGSGKTSLELNSQIGAVKGSGKYTKKSEKIQWNYWDEEKEGKPLDFIKSGGCGCEEPCAGWVDGKDGIRKWEGGKNYPWTRQIATIKIEEPDVVSENGQEIFNVMEDRGIENVIVMGVHTNLCVSGRPFGLRQMKYYGKNVVLVRDLHGEIIFSSAG